MKNIADVNSDDILSELNNLDYDDEELKLLDDEDSKKEQNKSTNNPDLTNFYIDYDANQPSKKETYEDKSKQNKDNNQVSNQSVSSIDDYLNRKTANNKNTANNYSTINNQKVDSNPLTNQVKDNHQDNKYQTINQPKNPTNTKVGFNDLNVLFDRVSNNVKGASQIVNRNTEIKKKIDERFEELRRLQQEHEANKKSDYEQINAYKDEVYSKLQQKKSDIEKDLIELRNNQEKLEKEKKEFEDYKNTSLSNLKKLENELKES